ncbi:ScbA/BarX family gamma-butyrolactone biosynthesis protein [Streptomyces sp. NPDC089922]|uniref:ScbA/BarX family gamma-butyrolactone biosynthesis protein n=1 Tax=Streptomyces sp. NPDC089922 TaxID=3155189 RepID=UPI0034290D05
MTMLTIRHNTPAPPLTPAGEPWTRHTTPRTLTTTVPREYVHRRSHAEVFLTGCHRTGPHTFTLTGQWPRAHTFFTSPDGTRHDPLQVGETIRQSGLYLCHTAYGVPLDHHILLWSLDFTTHPDQLHIGTTPTDLTITATCTDFTRKGNRLTGTLHATLHRGNHPTGHGTAHFTTIPPTTYNRLRRPHTTPPTNTPTTPNPHPHHTPHPPLTPTTTGRHHPHDVILTPTHNPHQFTLTPDLTHPILFEHTNDHHPGMVLIEAARQATHHLHHPHPYTPTTITTHFHTYAELHTPTTLTTTTHTPTHTTITAHQNNTPIYTTTLTTNPTQQQPTH